MGDPNVDVLIEQEKISLRYYPKDKIVHHELRAFVHGPDFRNLLEKGLEIFQRFGACKWLSDDRGNSALTAEDGKWALEDWAPRVMAAGWKYWAVVMPQKIVGQMNMNRWIKAYAEQGVTVRCFPNPDEALAWLRQQQ